MITVDAELFWQYSIKLYGHSALADLYLKLQNEEGLNVNVLLLCSFLAENNYLASTQTIRQIIENKEFSSWNQSMTGALRSSRTQLKKDNQDSLRADLRRSILNAELQAEQIEQQLLITAFEQYYAPITAMAAVSAHDNIINYWQAHTKKATCGDLLTLIQQLQLHR
jgi:uncharacterized protein (TIGR02444 family)